MANQNFESKLNSLENLVKQLEQQNLPLDEAIKTFQQGIQLAKECQNKLAKAEQTIQQLTKDNQLENITVEENA